MKLLESLNDKILYHGTSFLYMQSILRIGLKPQPADKYVYFTENKKAAEKYSKAWTAAIFSDLDPDDERNPFKKEFLKEHILEGIILKFKIPINILEIDDYNLDGEPGQYKYEGIFPIKKYMIGKEIKKFNELKNKTELLKNYAYWIGVVRR